MKLNPYVISGICLGILVSILIGLAVGGVFGTGESKSDDAIATTAPPTHKKLDFIFKGSTGNDKFTMKVDDTDLLVDHPLTAGQLETHSFNIPLESQKISFNFADSGDDILIDTLSVDGTSILPNFVRTGKWDPSKDTNNKYYDHAIKGGLYWSGTYEYTI